MKNEASFAVWRQGPRKYTSTADGISQWLHTTAAVGVRLNLKGEMEMLAPHGLEDLFNGIIRPCPAISIIQNLAKSNFLA